MSKSCVGCKFLYAQDVGYSNYTVEDTEIDCAKNANDLLPADRPYDWNESEESDNWPKTRESRCAHFARGPMIHLDVERESKAADFTDDAEVIALIDGPVPSAKESL